MGCNRRWHFVASVLLLSWPCSSFVIVPSPSSLTMLPGQSAATSVRPNILTSMKMGARSEVLGWLKRKVLAGSALVTLALSSPLPSRAVGAEPASAKGPVYFDWQDQVLECEE